MRPEDTAGFGPVGTNATAPQPLTAARLAEIRGRHIMPWALCECDTCTMRRDIAALLADNERLRAALRFYAAPSGAVPDFYDELSFGDTARAALGEDSHG